MKLTEIPSILQKYSRINIKISTINSFCTIAEPDCQYQSPKYSKKLKNNRALRTRFLRFYIYDIYQELAKDITTISITKDGLFYDIDKTLAKIEQIYNIKFSSPTIKEDLHNLKQRIREIKCANDLSTISTPLKEDYLSFEKATKSDYKRQFQKNSTVTYQLLKKFKFNQIDNINYLLQNLDNNFASIRNCNHNLDIIDKDKLNLVIAHQIMLIHQKKKDKDTLEYLKQYLIQNESLLESNYQISKFFTNQLGLREKKTYSIRAIYQYLYNVMNPKPPTVKTEPSSSPTYEFNFLESDQQNHHEILSKYYQLGITSSQEKNLTELLARKIAYYSTLPIETIFLGKNKFDGYLGFCLKDGTVILDKLFEDFDKLTIATDEAIYLTDKDNFEKIICLSKTDCIDAIKQGKVKAKRQIHAGNWENALNQKRIEE